MDVVSILLSFNSNLETIAIGQHRIVFDLFDWQTYKSNCLKEFEFCLFGPFSMLCAWDSNFEATSRQMVNNLPINGTEPIVQSLPLRFNLHLSNDIPKWKTHLTNKKGKTQSVNYRRITTQYELATIPDFLFCWNFYLNVFIQSPSK